LFSYAFFWEGYTGLTITSLCIVTLFVAMQMTGKTDWTVAFAKGGAKSSGIPPPKIT
jgi:hypothetical protein